MDREERNRIFEKAGVRKTPMLFIDDQYVGDYDDVSVLTVTKIALASSQTFTCVLVLPKFIVIQHLVGLKIWQLQIQTSVNYI